ncbi:MAG: SMC-Scp complex subunit ScpB [Chloroflexi bacterium]|nr:SMC-Scp complex subunit ScpB [Chloroflexota bacterium]
MRHTQEEKPYLLASLLATLTASRSAARIDETRGPNSDAAVSFPLQRKLVAEQRPWPDAPAVLVTTVECLAYLGLASLDELPCLQAIADTSRSLDVLERPPPPQLSQQVNGA